MTDCGLWYTSGVVLSLNGRYGVYPPPLLLPTELGGPEGPLEGPEYALGAPGYPLGAPEVPLGVNHAPSAMFTGPPGGRLALVSGYDVEEPLNTIDSCLWRLDCRARTTI